MLLCDIHSNICCGLRCRLYGHPCFPTCLKTQASIFSVQVTIWEALTNSKPGTHPFPSNSSHVDRYVLLPWYVHISWMKVITHLLCLLFPGPRRTGPAPPPASCPAPLRRCPPPVVTIRNCVSPWRCQLESRKGRSFSSHTRRNIWSNSSSCC